MNGKTRQQQHFTTRRGFITAAGFGVVSLYALWAGYGAAPLPFLTEEAHGHSDPDGQRAASESGGHGGHGAATGGPHPEEFRRLVQEFVETHKLADGSVRPMPASGPGAAAGGHAGMHHPAEITPPPEASAPIDVYLMAYQWGYLPSVIRLERDVAYRFRMMAVDVTHGATLRIANGSRVIRLRSGVLVEQELRFKQPGSYLVYCTTYCGLAHDRMHGQIIVT